MKHRYTYRYTFEDGYWCWYCGKMDKNELAWEERKHGKCVSIVKW